MNEHIEEYELMNNTHRPTHPKWILPKWKAISAKFTFCAESHTDLESAGRPLASDLIGQARKCKPGLFEKGYWAWSLLFSTRMMKQMRIKAPFQPRNWPHKGTIL